MEAATRIVFFWKVAQEAQNSENAFNFVFEIFMVQMKTAWSLVLEQVYKSWAFGVCGSAV